MVEYLANKGVDEYQTNYLKEFYKLGEEILSRGP